MKYNLKMKRSYMMGLIVPALMAVSLGSVAQSAQRGAAVMADASIGKLAITDFTGEVLDANNIPQEQLLKLTLPVGSENHGKALPAGSCKIKIGFGSKLALDPGFDLNTVAASNYFKWSSVISGGQLQLTGELVKELPADVHALDLAVRVKAVAEGKSTITANFLISNHNTKTILSDENGNNNSSYLSYRVAKKFDLINQVPNGDLKMSVYPNPAKDVSSVNIKLVQGRMSGKYSISLYDIAGKLLQSKEMEVGFVNNINYNFGNIVAGKYLIKVASADSKKSTILKFEKF